MHFFLGTLLGELDRMVQMAAKGCWSSLTGVSLIPSHRAYQVISMLVSTDFPASEA